MATRLLRTRLAWVIISIFWVGALVSKFYFNGLIFGLDFGLYQPDGAFYTFKTLSLLGRSPLEAAQEISIWYQSHAFKMNVIDPQNFLAGYKDSWALVQSRYLYPVLSIPFVALLGIPGMIAVPSISLLVTAICAFEVCKKYMQPTVGFILAIYLTISPTATRWSFVNCTDSILMAMFSILVLTILNKPSRNFLKISALILFTSITRFCLPIWVAIICVDFYRNKIIKRTISFLHLAILGSIPALISSSSGAFLPSQANSTILDKVLSLPKSFIKVTFYEFAELFVLDRILFILLASLLVYSFLNYKKVESLYFLAVFISTLLLGAINGTIGVNFRYQLPVLSFIAPLLSLMLSSKNNLSGKND